MGKYFDKNVTEGLTHLPGSGKPKEQRYAHYSSLVQQGHTLIGVGSNGLWDVVADVSHPEDFDHFEMTYSSGNFIQRDYYSVPNDRLTNPR